MAFPAESVSVTCVQRLRRRGRGIGVGWNLGASMKTVTTIAADF